VGLVGLTPMKELAKELTVGGISKINVDKNQS
jgi:hypothetical protein